MTLGDVGPFALLRSLGLKEVMPTQDIAFSHTIPDHDRLSLAHGQQSRPRVGGCHQRVSLPSNLAFGNVAALAAGARPTQGRSVDALPTAYSGARRVSRRSGLPSRTGLSSEFQRTLPHIASILPGTVLAGASGHTSIESQRARSDYTVLKEKVARWTKEVHRLSGMMTDVDPAFATASRGEPSARSLRRPQPRRSTCRTSPTDQYGHPAVWTGSTSQRHPALRCQHSDEPEQWQTSLRLDQTPIRYQYGE